MKKASILGGNGYTGLELIKILSRHPNVRLTHVSSRKEAGQPVKSVFPEINFTDIKTFTDINDSSAIAKDSDIIFSCLPHSSSAIIARPYIEKGIKVVDLSADFRYRDIALYESTYNVTHACPSYLDKAVYGLPEVVGRKAIASSLIVGNPGCYTTSAILPLYPLLKENIIESKSIIIDAKSGTSGAGRKPDIGQLFAEVSEDFKAYGVTTHRHTSEIEEVLSITSSQDVTVSFTPHLLPIKRGILSTIYAKLTNSETTEGAIYDIYRQYYGNENFVEILKNELPQIKYVNYSNMCKIGFKLDKKNNQLIIISCLDNLIKGASGQAVQNMNIMFGFKESDGLLY